MTIQASFPGSIEVLAVGDVDNTPDPSLAGAHLDRPTPSSTHPAAQVAISGWAIGRDVRVRRVEVWLGTVLVGEAAVDRPRPDLVSAFVESLDAGRSGFSLTADVRGHDGSVLRVEVLLDDGRRVALGHVRGVRTQCDRLTGPGVILLYHRVGTGGSDPWGLSVSPTHFDEHMAVLRRMMRPLPLSALVESVRRGRVEPGAVAVTFDDGYADALENATPVLEGYDVPGTFFLTTGAIGGAHDYWWDELERLVLHPEIFPSRLRLQIDEECVEWSLGLSATSPADVSDRVRGWRAWFTTAPTPRHALYRDLWRRCQRLAADGRERIMDQLRAIESDLPRAPAHRVISEPELLRLAAHPLYDIGSHSVTHAALASLPTAAQALEIRGSKQWLEERLGRPVTLFAYPYGGVEDYDAGCVRLVADAGFTGACANVPGIVATRADHYQLPRLFVEDWDGDALAQRLVALCA
jgi:peptidoglycan/xylan/chitin deacetylase (PgdA/CDA1 family)